MFRNQLPSFPNVSTSNYYPPKTSDFGDPPNWLGLPMWIATDVIVAVGERQFHAHRSVLSANSAYFRSELATSSSPDPKHVTKPLVLTPTWATCVGSKTFSLLLDFMYSSQLPLDSANVLEVLSAAQTLMIPRAIELCRGYLLQRHLTGCLSDFYSLNRNFPHPPPPPPPPPSHFNLSLGTPDRVPAFFPTCNVERSAHTYFSLNPTAEQYGSSSRNSFHTIIRPIPSKIPFSVLPAVIAGPLRSTSTITSSSTVSSAAVESLSKAPEDPEISSTSKRDEIAAPENVSTVENVKVSTAVKSDDNASPSCSNEAVKEFVDIACCDGPVKFQKVLNTNCNLVIMMMSDAGGSAKNSETCEVEPEKMVEEPKTEVNNDSKPIPEEDEDKTATSSASKVKMPTKSGNKRVYYQCIYCRHTYKSLCCYLKHKQRHLNPKSKMGFKVGSDGGVGGGDCESVEINEEEESNNDNQKQSEPNSVHEINVPFYPCRVCGLKFPSYYFVHKHRRACHKLAQEDD